MTPDWDNLEGGVVMGGLAPVAGLKANPNNPRRISDRRFRALMDSMQRDPAMMLARPVIATDDHVVIAGNMRLRAAKELGWATIPVVYATLDELREREWAIRDNREYGEDDDQALAEMAYEHSKAGGDLSMTGLTDDELLRLLRMVGVEPEGEPEAPPPPDAPVEVRLRGWLRFDLDKSAAMYLRAEGRDRENDFGAEVPSLLLGLDIRAYEGPASIKLTLGSLRD